VLRINSVLVLVLVLACQVLVLVLVLVLACWVLDTRLVFTEVLDVSPPPQDVYSTYPADSVKTHPYHHLDVLTTRHSVRDENFGDKTNYRRSSSFWRP